MPDEVKIHMNVNNLPLVEHSNIRKTFLLGKVDGSGRILSKESFEDLDRRVASGIAYGEAGHPQLGFIPKDQHDTRLSIIDECHVAIKIIELIYSKEHKSVTVTAVPAGPRKSTMELSGITIAPRCLVIPETGTTVIVTFDIVSAN